MVKIFYQMKIGTWNCYSLSNDTTTVRIWTTVYWVWQIYTRTKEQFKDKQRIYIHNTSSKVDGQGKCSDPEAGVTIILSSRMVTKILDSGHIYTNTCCNKTTLNPV